MISYEKLLIRDNKEEAKKCFFIDRNGKKHKYKGPWNEEIISMHERIARQIYPDKEYASDYVKKELGWIMMGSTVYSVPIIYFKPSEKQIETLKKLGRFDRLCFYYEKHNTFPNYEKYGILAEEFK